MSSKYTVEKNVPLPDRNYGQTYPLKDMEIGDSFELPIGRRNSCMVSAGRIEAKTGKRFISRKVDESTVRVWRKK